MLTRMVRAYGRRVANADPEDLATMTALRAEVDRAIEVAVQGQRERHSWTEIAAPLGVTRQAARQKWGK